MADKSKLEAHDSIWARLIWGWRVPVCQCCGLQAIEAIDVDCGCAFAASSARLRELQDSNKEGGS